MDNIKRMVSRSVQGALLAILIIAAVSLAL
jgi:hypothetical protein